MAKLLHCQFSGRLDHLRFTIAADLPGNGLCINLHARSIASIGPRSVHHAIWTRDDLGVVAEESAARKSYTGIERPRADRLLCREGFASVGRLADKVLHLGQSRIVPIVIPTDVDRSVTLARRPWKEVMPSIAERIVIHTMHGGRARPCVDYSDVHTRRAFQRAARNLACRKCAVRRVADNPTARRDRTEITESPVRLFMPL